ncbi:discoidin domain-containing protein [Actinoplanes sp. RD1]|uniref:discoidin domain-containing protein n=1 Tax=Actinoplanes sp. RD1 TaxID=3064538 RepID=UPI0027428B65|nr:discoidin domain-containing protein [Actinoplanes sp. RD1]
MIGPAAAVVLAAAVGVPVWFALQAEAPIGGNPAGVPLTGGGAAAGTPERPVVPSSAAPLAAAPAPGASAAGAPSASAGARPSSPGKPATGKTPGAAPATSKPASPGTPGPGATARPGTGADLALRRPVTVSGLEGDAYAAAKAVDGDDATRWSSNWSEDTWIAVDLGDTWAVSRVEVLWERSYAEEYHIDVSTDGRTWRTAVSGVAGAEGKVGTALADVPARWVRIVNDRRHQDKYGISLFSLAVR